MYMCACAWCIDRDMLHIHNNVFLEIRFDIFLIIIQKTRQEKMHFLKASKWRPGHANNMASFETIMLGFNDAAAWYYRVAMFHAKLLQSRLCFYSYF